MDSEDVSSKADDAGDSGESPAKADDAKDSVTHDPVPAAEGAPNNQRLADPSQELDPDRPGYDVDGKPVVTERDDGRVHYANDPEETFRDPERRLQNNTGGYYTEDPYRASSQEIDYPQTLPERHAVEVASENRAAWDSTNEEWARVHDEAEEPIRNADEALKRARELGIDISPKADGPKTDYIQKSITAAMLHADDATKAELSEISRQIDHGVIAKNAKVDASEWVGDTAGTLRDAQLERHTVLGDAAPTLQEHQRTPPGMFDRVSIAKDEQTLVVGENKGGDSPRLGTREIASGKRAQQGSPEYCMDLLTGKNQDPRLMPAFKALEDAGKHKDFFAALRGEGVDVIAELVNARTSGNIRAGQFDFNGSMKLRMETVDGADELVVDFFREGS